jgi:hypothetical protein
VQNIAIVLARTDAAERACLAESMQHGTPELTMQDAVRAAQAEMRRAARARDLAATVAGPDVGAPGAACGMGMRCDSIGGRASGRCLAWLCGRSNACARRARHSPCLVR